MAHSLYTLMVYTDHGKIALQFVDKSVMTDTIVRLRQAGYSYETDWPTTINTNAVSAMEIIQAFGTPQAR